MNIQQSFNQAVAATAFLTSQSPAYKQQQELKALGRKQEGYRQQAIAAQSRAAELENEMRDPTKWAAMDEQAQAGHKASIEKLNAEAGKAWEEVTRLEGERAQRGITQKWIEEMETLGFGAGFERYEAAQTKALLATQAKARTKEERGWDDSAKGILLRGVGPHVTGGDR